MEDRYEIRGKIGQGGLGAVYRALDKRMNREVAIKRILVNSDDKALEEESTRQLAKEAGALAALQHPHIVTVYDVGADEDGPFVVMELLSGKAIDELISRAPMTWADFREFALQTQEALIAAQDLHMVHRDLKPANIMVNWLPSGKFQVKIVDFGLAKLSPKPSLQTLDQSESVFGSIFFMAPEQFERVPLDPRTDMYAIGCVYYYALTGFYPFDGDTGPQVMAAHLQHTVRPLQEVRSEIPLWLCDWIMWHINRMPNDRPEGARESLRVFLENDVVPNPPMSTGTPPGISSDEWPYRTSTARVRPAVPGPPKLPTSKPDPLHMTTPQPLLPPEGSRPSVHTAPQNLRATQSTPTAPAPPAAPAPLKPGAPRPPAPAGPRPARGAPPKSPAAAAAASAETPAAKKAPVTAAKKTEKPVANKKPLYIGGAIALALLLAVAYYFGSNFRLKQAVAPILNAAAAPNLKELPVNSLQIDTLLRASADKDFKTQLPTLYRALTLAKSTDATDIDRRILQFLVRQQEMPEGVRENLIREVIGKRGNRAVADDLIRFASQVNAKDRQASSAALQISRQLERKR
ncbi:MAG: serine/threonine-protein kinase [Luteolibacter sp.]